MSRSDAGATPARLSQHLARSPLAVPLPEQARCYRQISEKHHGSASSGEVRLHKAVVIGLFLGSSYSFTVMLLFPRGRADILRLAFRNGSPACRLTASRSSEPPILIWRESQVNSTSPGLYAEGFVDWKM